MKASKSGIRSRLEGAYRRETETERECEAGRGGRGSQCRTCTYNLYLFNIINIVV